MTDHISPFRELFKLVKVSRMLEFGLGVGTKFFAEHCDYVVSVELSTKGLHDRWFKKVEDYKLKNWKGYNFKTVPDFNKEMEDYIVKHLDKYKYDLIFVDPGVHCRPEILNLCFGRAPIIVTHDTNHGAYGWEKIVEHKDYVSVEHKGGSGTIFWFKDKSLAKKLEDNLRIWLPQTV